MELQTKTWELARYTSTHVIYIDNLFTSFNSQNNTGIRNIAYYRHLYLVILSPDLDRVSTLNEKAAIIERFYHKHQDHDVSLPSNEAETGHNHLPRPAFVGVLPVPTLRQAQLPDRPDIYLQSASRTGGR